MKKSIQRKYANLIVRVGANVQPGQPVIIYASADQHDFVTLLVEECYKAKAKQVAVEWSFQPITKLNYKKMSVKTLGTVPEWRLSKMQWQIDNVPATIHLMSEDPDGLKGINPEKVQKARQMSWKVLKPYSDKMEEITNQWTIAAVPSVAWAKKVFPDLPKKKAVEKLYETILHTVRLKPDGSNDPIAEWKKHNDTFIARAKWLNDNNFDYVTYKSKNGTDFKCELIKEGCWHGGKDKTKQGMWFNPNLPTEEIYTSPMKGKCEGKLVATKPLSYQGQLIEDFWVTFKNGKAVRWGAKKGKELLEKMIKTDEGSCQLGELALIPYDSPINKTGVLFYNTLFDENACCHVALGMGFADCLKDFENRSLEDARKLGINESMIHVDFMIGSDDLEITGYKNGKATPIFKNGNWATKIK